MTRYSILCAKPISAERFDEMLNILPPLNWHGEGAVAVSFRLTEMRDLDTVTIFVRIGSPSPAPKYFELSADPHVTHAMVVQHCRDLLRQTTGTV